MQILGSEDGFGIRRGSCNEGLHVLFRNGMVKEGGVLQE